MYRKQDSTIANASFVPLGLVLGNAHSNQATCNSPDCGTHADASQCWHNRTGCDKRTQAGYR